MKPGYETSKRRVSQDQIARRIGESIGKNKHRLADYLNTRANRVSPRVLLALLIAFGLGVAIYCLCLLLGICS